MWAKALKALELQFTKGNNKRTSIQPSRRLRQRRALLEQLEPRLVFAQWGYPLVDSFSGASPLLSPAVWESVQGSFSQDGKAISVSGSQRALAKATFDQPLSTSVVISGLTTSSEAGLWLSGTGGDSKVEVSVQHHADRAIMEVLRESGVERQTVSRIDLSQRDVTKLSIQYRNGEIGIFDGDVQVGFVTFPALSGDVQAGIVAEGAAEIDDFQISQFVRNQPGVANSTKLTWSDARPQTILHMIVADRHTGEVFASHWTYHPSVEVQLPTGEYEIRLAESGGSYSVSYFDVMPLKLSVSTEDPQKLRVAWGQVNVAGGILSIHVEDVRTNQEIVVRQMSETDTETTFQLPIGSYRIRAMSGGVTFGTAVATVTTSLSDGYEYEAPGKATVYWAVSSPGAPVWFVLVNKDGNVIRQYWNYQGSERIDEVPGNYRVLVAESGQAMRTIELPIADYSNVQTFPISPMGMTSNQQSVFTWFPVEGARVYYFIVEGLDSSFSQAFWAYRPEAVVNTPPGRYRWRVIPLNERNEQSQIISWFEFEVSGALIDRENIIGLEPDLPVPSSLAKLTYPESVVADHDGDLYIADTLNHVIRKVHDGRVEVFAGTLEEGYSGDGFRTSIQLSQPVHLQFDDSGSLWVLGLGGLLRKIDMTTGQTEVVLGVPGASRPVNFPSSGSAARNVALPNVSTFELVGDRIFLPFWASTTSGVSSALYSIDLSLPAEQWKFTWERDLAYPVVDVSISSEHMELLYNRFTQPGLFERYILGGELIQQVELGSAFAGGIAHDELSGDVYLGDHTQVIKLNQAGQVSVFADGFANVPDLSISGGTIHILDGDRGVLHRYSLDGTRLREFQVGGSEFHIDTPVRQAKYGENQILIMENKRGLILLNDLVTGRTTVFAGNGKLEPATVEVDKMQTGFFYAVGLAVDHEKNVYVAENHRILKIDVNGRLSLFAGNDHAGYAGDGGLAINASFTSIRDLKFDETGNLYVADTYNSVIRMITPAGIISTIAGTGMPGPATYGVPATSSQLNHPHSIQPLPDGSILIADSWNNIVSRRTPEGLLVPFAGWLIYGGYQGSGLFFGDGGAAVDAQFNTPTGLSVDHEGNVYIADNFNHRIRVVSSDGKIDTFWGGGQQGYRADGSLLNFPIDVLATDDYVVVADTGNGLVSRLHRAQIN